MNKRTNKQCEDGEAAELATDTYLCSRRHSHKHTEPSTHLISRAQVAHMEAGWTVSRVTAGSRAFVDTVGSFFLGKSVAGPGFITRTHPFSLAALGARTLSCARALSYTRASHTPQQGRKTRDGERERATAAHSHMHACAVRAYMHATARSHARTYTPHDAQF